MKFVLILILLQLSCLSYSLTLRKSGKQLGEDLMSKINTAESENEPKRKDMGINFLNRFLVEDDEEIKSNGGIYDESGFDGLVSTEQIAPQGSEERTKQRARSAALLWAKDHDPNISFEAMGCSPSIERVSGWNVFNVLLLAKDGTHKVVKSCIQEKEGQMITFVLEQSMKCQDKVGFVDKFQKKNEEYMKPDRKISKEELDKMLNLKHDSAKEQQNIAEITGHADRIEIMNEGSKPKLIGVNELIQDQSKPEETPKNSPLTKAEERKIDEKLSNLNPNEKNENLEYFKSLENQTDNNQPQTQSESLIQDQKPQNYQMSSQNPNSLQQPQFTAPSTPIQSPPIISQPMYAPPPMIENNNYYPNQMMQPQNIQRRIPQLNNYPPSYQTPYQQNPYYNPIPQVPMPNGNIRGEVNQMENQLSMEQNEIRNVEGEMRGLHSQLNTLTNMLQSALANNPNQMRQMPMNPQFLQNK